MIRSAGELNRKITVQRATGTPNAYNEPILTWTDYLSVWAKRTDASDGEKFAAGQVGSFLVTRFVVRSSVAARGILPSDRIVHDGIEYNIDGIKEQKDGRREFLEITARGAVPLPVPDLQVEQIEGLVRGWQADHGVTTDANGITTIQGIQDTGVPLVQSGTTQPDLAAGLGPLNQDLIEFTSARTEHFTFTATDALTSGSVFFAVAPKTVNVVANALLGRNLGQSNIQMPAAGGRIDCRTVSGGVNIQCPLPVSRNTNLQIIELHWTAGGQVVAYVDGRKGTPANIDASGFIFNRLGVLATSTNPLNAHLGEVRIYNRRLSDTERAVVYNYMSDKWRGRFLWVANEGSDSSITPWNQSTPYATIGRALQVTFHGGETIAPKGGQIFRPTDKLEPTVAGQPNAPIVVDGSRWGNGKAQIRYSQARTPVLESGTVYSLGKAVVGTDIISAEEDTPSPRILLTVVSTVGFENGMLIRLSNIDGLTPDTDQYFIEVRDATHILLRASVLEGEINFVGSVFAAPGFSGGRIEASRTVLAPDVAGDQLTQGGYIFYIPGGTVTWTSTFVGGRRVNLSSNVVRLTEDKDTPATPAVGRWGVFDNVIYVNAGVALSTGMIEVSTPTRLFQIRQFHNHWQWKNLVTAFAEDRGFDDRAATLFENLEAWFCQSDGFDGFDPAATTLRGCIAAFCGRAPTVAGAFGDGFSWHDAAGANFEDCESWYCDKAGFNHLAGTITTGERLIAVGTMPYRMGTDEEDQGGSMTVQNSIAIIPAGSLFPHGFSQNSVVPCSMVGKNLTLINESGGLEGYGIGQISGQVQGALTVRNAIIRGFAVGASKQSTAQFSMTHNCYHNNGENYQGVSPGAGDIVADPRFVDFAGRDLRLQITSPCIGSGLSTLSKLDFLKRPWRSNDIGAVGKV